MKGLALLVVVIIGIVGGACEREERTHLGTQLPVAMSPLVVTYPGEPTPLPGAALDAAMPGYRETAQAVAEGKVLYRAFNCIGCHANGGGAMGPAFIDARWSYGSDPYSVAVSIVAGRPHGMPSYRGKLVPQQVYQLVAYVRALGGLVRGDAMAPRDDHIQKLPAPNLEDSGWPQRPEGT